MRSLTDCLNCGVQHKNAKYCCESCRREHEAKEPKIHIKKCKNCDKEFESKNKTLLFCNKKCAGEYRKLKKAGDTQNRPYEKETAYLIRLWTKQGKSLQYIALALGRSIENVKLAFKEG